MQLETFLVTNSTVTSLPIEVHLHRSEREKESSTEAEKYTGCGWVDASVGMRVSRKDARTHPPSSVKG